MQYDFTTILDRHGKDAMAVDGVGKAPGMSPEPPKEGFDLLPMWVADMNFATVPTIPKALAERAAHPLYGYFRPTDAYFDAIINWHRTQNGVENLTRADIGYENGVLGGVVSALNVFCSRGDNVLLLSPTYIGFTISLENNGYHIVLSPMTLDANGIWRMNFADMEQKLASKKIHAAVVCSPHNPTGRVWERWELEQMMELFRKYDVMVVSDEIWSDLTMPEYQHIPTQSVSADARERTVALYAPSKTFNLAGLIGSYHIIYNPTLRDRVRKESSTSHYNGMNVLSMHALIGAYTDEGREWLVQLREVLKKNIDTVAAFLHENVPDVHFAVPQGTYMMFLDCTDYCARHGLTIDTILRRGWDVGVAWQTGRPFHGPCHIRANLALLHSQVLKACERMKRYVFCD